MVFSNPNFATAVAAEGFEPYGLLRLLERKGYLTPFPEKAFMRPPSALFSYHR
jgi:hypothetical protein